MKGAAAQTFADRLLDVIDQKQSTVVVGLDPDPARLPQHLLGRHQSKYGHGLRATAAAIVEFNAEIIDAIHDIAIAVKPQVAFYEALGIPGLAALKQTIKYAHTRGLIVIQDAKRGDIGSTAKAYAMAHIGFNAISPGQRQSVFGADAVTINPLLGSDSVEPFLRYTDEYGKGVFVLVKTSNPSSSEIQDLKIISRGKARHVYEAIAMLVNRWGQRSVGKRGYSSVGAVVGATFPEQARVLRQLMPKAIFLVPGYGAQGGTARDVANCFNSDGYGAIVNSSRDIIFAYQRTSTKDFAQAARESAKRMRDDIQAALRQC